MTFDKVRDIVDQLGGASEITDETHLMKDLEADSDA